MLYGIAQLSDVHIGGPTAGSGDRLSAAVDGINEMGRQPDLVLLTGDNTHNGTEAEWAEFTARMNHLRAPWLAISGNHDPSRECPVPASPHSAQAEEDRGCARAPQSDGSSPESSLLSSSTAARV